MKSYLKMSDVFGGCVISNIFREIKCEGDVVVAVAKTGSAAQAISHAINSHDELVQMNQELLAALEGLLDIVGDSDGVSGYHLNGDIAEWGEFEELNAAYDAINKANGGAA